MEKRTAQYNRLPSVVRRLRKIAKATLVSSCLSVCPSIHLHGTSRVPLNGFSWNLLFEYLSKIYPENSGFIENLTRTTRTLYEDQCAFFIISRSFLLKMGNVSGDICRENQKTHSVFNNFTFFKPRFCEITWKNIVEPGKTQMTLRGMRIACWIPKSTNTFYFSTATMVTHKRHEVRLYVHFLSCYTISLSCLRSSNEHRRKGIFSCAYQFNLSITVRHLPNNTE